MRYLKGVFRALNTDASKMGIVAFDQWFILHCGVKKSKYCSWVPFIYSLAHMSEAELMLSDHSTSSTFEI